METYITIYVALGVLNTAFHLWSRRAQYRIMGEEENIYPQPGSKAAWAFEAFCFWPVYLLLNLTLWAYVLIKGRKAQ